MKLKTLVSSMALLGLVSTGVSAVTAGGADAVADNSNSFWKGIMLRNQDNNGSMPTLANGQTTITGAIKTDLVHLDKRNSYASTSPNNKGATVLNLNNAEVYVDSQINDWAAAHVAYDVNNTALSEAYALLTYDNFYLTAGQQFLNFGSFNHNSTYTPPAQQLSEIYTVAVTGGVMNVNGFYADASIYNGTPYGTPYTSGQDPASSTTSPTYDSSYFLHGYVAEIGYAMNEGMNPFYGYDGLNAYVDYIGNLADTSNISAVFAAQGEEADKAPLKQVPAVAVTAGYVSGPFQVLVDYVTAVKQFASTDGAMQWKGQGARPSAYDIEADYSWNTTHAQTISLSYGATQQLFSADFATTGSAAAVNFSDQVPASVIGVGYGYVVSPHVTLQGEYVYLKDYGTSDYASDPAVTGTGKAANGLIGRIKVAF